jgi:amidase
MVHWVAELRGLDILDAYQLVTQAIEAPLANVCDTNYTSIAKMPKRYLPRSSATPMEGTHARLRNLASEYCGTLRSGSWPAGSLMAFVTKCRVL